MSITPDATKITIKRKNKPDLCFQGRFLTEKTFLMQDSVSAYQTQSGRVVFQNKKAQSRYSTEVISDLSSLNKINGADRKLLAEKLVKELEITESDTNESRILQMLNTIHNQTEDEKLSIGTVLDLLHSDSWESSTMRILLDNQSQPTGEIDPDKVLSGTTELQLRHGFKSILLTCGFTYRQELGLHEPSKGKVFTSIISLDKSIQTTGFIIVSDDSLDELDESDILNLLNTKELKGTVLDPFINVSKNIYSEIKKPADCSLRDEDDANYFHLEDGSDPSILLSGERLGSIKACDALESDLTQFPFDISEITIYKSLNGPYAVHSKIVNAISEVTWLCTIHHDETDVRNYYGYSDFAKDLYKRAGIASAYIL